ncbi:hypothetical protein [Terasakiella pusilla]|uniref:hypothetical protein n=1 Tax=Terasakiella pusilla TaxID=64973 RepID=UPI003AA92733
MGTETLTQTLENIQSEEAAVEEQQSEQTDQDGPEENPIDFDDPDVVALEEARKEVEAEEAGTFQNEEDDQGEAEQEAEALLNRHDDEQESKVSQDEPESKEDVRIPKARFDEVNEARKQEAERARQLELENAELKGKLSVTNPAQKTEQVAEPETPQNEISRLENQIYDLWNQVEDGQLTMADARREERKFEARIRQLDASTQPVTREQQKASYSDELYLQEKTVELVQSSQATLAFLGLGLNENSAEWAFVNAKATERLNAENLTLETPAGLLRFRQLQTNTIEENASWLVPDFKAAPTASDIPKTKGPSPEAKEREKKLELAQRQPASTNAMADSGSVHDLSLEKLSELTEEEFEALPASIRNKAMEGIIE